MLPKANLQKRQVRHERGSWPKKKTHQSQVASHAEFLKGFVKSSRIRNVWRIPKNVGASLCLSKLNATGLYDYNVRAQDRIVGLENILNFLGRTFSELYVKS